MTLLDVQLWEDPREQLRVGMDRGYSQAKGVGAPTGMSKANKISILIFRAKMAWSGINMALGDLRIHSSPLAQVFGSTIKSKFPWTVWLKLHRYLVALYRWTHGLGKTGGAVWDWAGLEKTGAEAHMEVPVTACSLPKLLTSSGFCCFHNDHLSLVKTNILTLHLYCTYISRLYQLSPPHL